MRNHLKKLFDKAFSRYVSTGLIFVLDVLLSFVSALLVIFFVHSVVTNSASSLGSLDYWNRFNWIWLVTTTVSAALMFWIFKSFRVIIRHSTMVDVFRFGMAVFCATAIDGAVLALAGMWHRTTWLILVVYFVLCIFLLVTFRVLMIRVYEELQRRFRLRGGSLMRVLIYGTGEKCIALETRLRSSKHYDVVGFLTDVQSESRMTTHNTPVFMFESIDDVRQILEKQAVKGIIFARDSDIRLESQRLIPFATENKIRLLVAPSIDDFANVNAQNVRNIKVEDLLGRDEIAISMDKIKERFSGKVVLVTGASGSIGSELCRQLARLGVKKLVLYDNAETPMHNLRLELEEKFKDLNFVPVIGDVRQRQRLDYVFRTWRPEVVFHAAAYKHVPLMEENK